MRTKQSLDEDPDKIMSLDWALGEAFRSTEEQLQIQSTRIIIKTNRACKARAHYLCAVIWYTISMCMVKVWNELTDI